MSTHTAGPWEIFVGKHPDPGYFRRVEVFPVATDICGGSPEECDANARLIAAAPDLLEALEALLSYANGYSDAMRQIGRGAEQLGEGADSESIAAQARRAIAKAKGESP